jgi:hypothetical protein
MIEWKIPIKTVSESNCMEHWAKKHKRHKAQKEAIAWELKPFKFVLPCSVWLTRIAPRKLDSDNLQGAFKWIRDAISETITGCKIAGRADDDPRISWHYQQEKGRPKEYAIKIAII